MVIAALHYAQLRKTRRHQQITQHQYPQRQQGTTIIEALVALSIFSIYVAVSYAFFHLANNQLQQARFQQQAAIHAYSAINQWRIDGSQGNSSKLLLQRFSTCQATACVEIQQQQLRFVMYYW